MHKIAGFAERSAQRPTPTATATSTPERTGAGLVPGFGGAAALLALVGGALLFGRRG